MFFLFTFCIVLSSLSEMFAICSNLQISFCSWSLRNDLDDIIMIRLLLLKRKTKIRLDYWFLSTCLAFTRTLQIDKFVAFMLNKHRSEFLTTSLLYLRFLQKWWSFILKDFLIRTVKILLYEEGSGSFLVSLLWLLNRKIREYSSTVDQNTSMVNSFYFHLIQITCLLLVPIPSALMKTKAIRRRCS